MKRWLLLALALLAPLGASAQQGQTYLPTLSAAVLSAASNNSQVIGAAGAHQIVEFTVLSTAATVAYIRIYDSATAPTCTSATGMIAYYPIPSVGAAGVTGFTLGLGALGKVVQNGIGICLTGAAGTTDNTNAPTGIAVNVTYY